MVVSFTLHSRRNVLKGLLVLGVATSLRPASVGAETLLVRGGEQNLLTNGSFEMNGLGSTISGWTITELQPEVNT